MFLSLFMSPFVPSGNVVQDSSKMLFAVWALDAVDVHTSVLSLTGTIDKVQPPCQMGENGR
jgi:hypothetical protein